MLTELPETPVTVDHTDCVSEVADSSTEPVTELGHEMRYWAPAALTERTGAVVGTTAVGVSGVTKSTQAK